MLHLDNINHITLQNTKHTTRIPSGRPIAPLWALFNTIKVDQSSPKFLGDATP